MCSSGRPCATNRVVMSCSCRRQEGAERHQEIQDTATARRGATTAAGRARRRTAPRRSSSPTSWRPSMMPSRSATSQASASGTPARIASGYGSGRRVTQRVAAVPDQVEDDRDHQEAVVVGGGALPDADRRDDFGVEQQAERDQADADGDGGTAAPRVDQSRLGKRADIHAGRSAWAGSGARHPNSAIERAQRHRPLMRGFDGVAARRRPASHVGRRARQRSFEPFRPLRLPAGYRGPAPRARPRKLPAWRPPAAPSPSPPAPCSGCRARCAAAPPPPRHAAR